MLRLSDAVAARARAAGVRGRTVQLKIKLADFRLLTRSRTLGEAADIAGTIAATARDLLREPELRAQVEATGARLLGVSVSNLIEAGGEQLALFGAGDARPVASNNGNTGNTVGAGGGASARPRDSTGERNLTEALDAIRSRFGTAAVGPAALAERGRLRVKQAGDTQWGPNREDDSSPPASSAHDS